jgi:hypothetical protein
MNPPAGEMWEAPRTDEPEATVQPRLVGHRNRDTAEQELAGLDPNRDRAMRLYRLRAKALGLAYSAGAWAPGFLHFQGKALALLDAARNAEATANSPLTATDILALSQGPILTCPRAPAHQDRRISPRFTAEPFVFIERRDWFSPDGPHPGPRRSYDLHPHPWPEATESEADSED